MMVVKELIDPQPIVTPATDAPWYVMLAAPQQEIPTVWRMHELGLELFVPVQRRRVKTGRIGKNGHKVTRVIPKPLFPGYGFLRCTDTNNPDALIWRDRQGCGIRGVRDFMRDEKRNFVTLSHRVVLAVFRRQIEEQQAWMAANGGRRASKWKPGDSVRIDEDGGAFAGLLATIESIDSKDRIHVLLKGANGLRTNLNADMVVAA